MDGNRKPSVTIYDIARLAGVSPSTVSRALNVPGRINAKTEKRIREAAAALNYRRNPMARALPTGRTSTLALILADITNPVFFTLVRGAERMSAAEGYTLVLADSHESGELEEETAGRLLPSVDGFVLVASRLDDDGVLRLAEHKPLVLANRQVPGVTSVVPDVAPGIRDALDHLVALGHRSLAFLSGPAASWMSNRRWETLLSEALQRGMSIVEIGPNAPTLDGGKSALQRVVASGFTAVITYNDLMAIGLLQACREAGIDVPGKLSIIGFDDIFGSELTTPPVTTIRMPLDVVGEHAVQRLISTVEGKDDVEQPSLSTELVVRGSTAVPKT
ncbi:MAG TPA: LacI family DNA-binding transcriptional regulator [Spirillospora sp.]|nr:LacI family DNA-binding transcriptional regulator [Spirillospora sp.]